MYNFSNNQMIYFKFLSYLFFKTVQFINHSNFSNQYKNTLPFEIFNCMLYEINKYLIYFKILSTDIKYIL